MTSRFVFTFVIAAMMTLAGPDAMAARRAKAPSRAAASAPAAPAVPSPLDPLRADIAAVRASARARDSLTTIADTSTGTSRDVLEELIWKRHVEVQSSLMAVAERLRSESSRADTATSRRLVESMMREQWPAYRVQLERLRRALVALGRKSDAATGVERLAIESDMTRLSERILESYQGFVDELLAFERGGVDITPQRAYLTQGLRDAATGLVTRVEVLARDRANAAAQLTMNTSSTDLRYALDATEERLKRATLGLSAVIHLMDRLGLEDSDLRVALILSTGRITPDVFRWKVLLGLLQAWGTHVGEVLAGRAPQWLFQLLLVGLTFIAFRWASRIVGRATRRAVNRSQLSELMRATVSRLAISSVMALGLVVILTQLGVQLAPMLAGLGIAGFALGFALQSTLANLAAGGLILGTRPFDLGDDIEAAGVAGTVKRMSLVSTTILTPDNQTLIVPNSSIWSGVIRNRTAEPIRRVDLTIGVSYADDIERVERVLREVVDADEKVLQEPAALIKVHQLAESSVNFVVRVWTRKERYWDVYWDLTRAIKLRFDREGITFPFPQQELHLNPGRGGEATIKVETKPGQS
jgi:small conductance mechanosensitive channel